LRKIFPEQSAHGSLHLNNQIYFKKEREGKSYSVGHKNYSKKREREREKKTQSERLVKLLALAFDTIL